MDGETYAPIAMLCGNGTLFLRGNSSSVFLTFVSDDAITAHNGWRLEYSKYNSLNNVGAVIKISDISHVCRCTRISDISATSTHTFQCNGFYQHI